MAVISVLKGGFLDSVSRGLNFNFFLKFNNKYFFSGIFFSDAGGSDGGDQRVAGGCLW
jgi:hypothetical protein